MAEYIDREKVLDELDKSARHHANNSREESMLFRDRTIVREQPTADVVEREKIDKAIEVITRIRDSTERMITEEVSVTNACLEQYVNCYDESLRIIKQNIGD